MLRELQRPLAILLLLALATACEQPEGALSPDAAPAAKAIVATRVETITLSPRPFEERIEMTGSVEALNDATLSAQSSGTVTKLLELGSTVERGQLVAQLDPAVLQASYEQARAVVAAADAGLALAKQNYERQKPLVEKKVISPLEFENLHAQYMRAEADLAQAKANEARARQLLLETKVIAPFPGRVEQHFVKQGEQVNPGGPIVRIVDSSTLKIRAGVPERYAADIALGAKVGITFGAYSIEPRSGTISFVGSAIDPKSRTFIIEVEIDNQDGRLKPEMMADMQVTRSTYDNALVLPLTALLHDEHGTSVFVIEREDELARAVRRQVEIKTDSGREVVIKSGLRPSDEVVVLGQSNLTSGDRVEVVKRQALEAETSMKSE